MTPAGFRKMLARVGVRSTLTFPIHPHMLRHDHLPGQWGYCNAMAGGAAPVPGHSSCVKGPVMPWRRWPENAPASWRFLGCMGGGGAACGLRGIQSTFRIALCTLRHFCVSLEVLDNLLTISVSFAQIAP